MTTYFSYGTYISDNLFDKNMDDKLLYYFKGVHDSLFIEVYVGSRHNRKLVASTHAYNISDLANTSNYEFISEEYGAPHLGIPATEVKGFIEKHRRQQSVWKLVEKIAGKSYEV